MHIKCKHDISKYYVVFRQSVLYNEKDRALLYVVRAGSSGSTKDRLRTTVDSGPGLVERWARVSISLSLSLASSNHDATTATLCRRHKTCEGRRGRDRSS